MSGELTDLSLIEVADAIRAGETSAREVTQACLARIERLQPRLNCFISLDAERALSAAEAADRRLAAGRVDGPLHGVPLAHKDMFYREGVVTSCGSRIRRDFRPDHTATVLQRLASAGALNLGGLNMSEFAISPTGHNAHFGAARNPWSPEHISCGSSSGSGVATAARLVYGALGSDTGGSIRLPAAACGLVGIKPTQTRVSRHGAMGLSFSLDNVGPLTRTVRDCARVLGVIAGRDDKDPTSSARSVDEYEAMATDADVRGLVVGVPENYYYDHIDDEIRAIVEASVEVLRASGARIVSVRVPHHEHLAGLANVLSGAEGATLHGAWLRDRPHDYGRQVLARLQLGLGYSATQYLRAQQVRPRIIRDFVTQVFSRCDVLHVPAVPVALPTIEESDVEDAQGFLELLAGISRCTRPLNYLAVPALAVPAGFTKRGLAVGFQLVARPFAESTLFRVGAAYQATTTWHRCAPEL